MHAPPLLIGIVALLSGAALVPACTYDFTLGPSTATTPSDGGTDSPSTSSGGAGSCSGKTCSCPSAATCNLKCGLDGIPCTTDCAPGSDCSLTCFSGNCTTNCTNTSKCVVDCPGGNCHTACAAGATCEVNCTGGNCDTTCDKDSNCTVNCTGGACTCTGVACK